MWFFNKNILLLLIPNVSALCPEEHDPYNVGSLDFVDSCFVTLVHGHILYQPC